MRIQKYLSEEGILSRRKAEEYIKAGKIFVNGKRAEIGQSIDPSKDKVNVTGSVSAFETIIINKPRGIVSSRIKTEGKTIYDLFPQYEKLHIAGRLDKESEGLLILTNDGVIAKKLTGGEHSVEKEYTVSVQENIHGGELAVMEHGVRLKDGMTLPAKVTKIDRNTFSIILKEGRNHQIRRMADKVHLTINRLERVRIGNIKIVNLKKGASRPLSAEEIDSLKRL